MDPDLPTLQKGRYVHAKSGNQYEVLGVALHSETHEPVVVYRPLYQTKYELFVRPYAMFVGDVEINNTMKPRFKRLQSDT